jgi:ATP-binding protein involved in chromosome partitioning
MRPQHGQPAPRIELSGIRHVVAVASGKGGVGKSTVAANLALALSRTGAKVGLMDADIYGPSVPIMMGVPGMVDQATTPLPLERYGIKLMSIGFVVPQERAVIWRGPMVDRALRQFLDGLAWAPLDYLILDLPPGTGDAQLTLSQHTRLTGAVIVTTPQDVSLVDARKGLEMFREVRVPVLGIVENMSYFTGDDGKRYEIFRHGGGKKLAEACGIPFLGDIPIDPRVAECGDQGEPIVHRYPDSPVAKAYLSLAQTVVGELEKQEKGQELPEVQM